MMFIKWEKTKILTTTAVVILFLLLLFSICLFVRYRFFSLCLTQVLSRISGSGICTWILVCLYYKKRMKIRRLFFIFFSFHFNQLLEPLTYFWFSLFFAQLINDRYIAIMEMKEIQ